MIETKGLTKDEVVITAQKQQESRQEFVGSIRPRKGHTLFEVNLKEKTIEPAKFEVQDAMYNPTGVLGSVNKVIIKPGCVYISALNKKNVLKKMFKKLDNHKRSLEESKN